MPKLEKISYTAIRLKEALPWPVYDSKGQLLLEKGFVVETENQLEGLIARGMFLTEDDARTLDEKVAEEPVRKPSRDPFADLKLWLRDLQEGYAEASERKPESLEVIGSLIQRIMDLCSDDPDACLAMVHIHAVEPSPAQQTLFYVVLAYLITSRLGYEESRIRQVVAAAMTANISLMPYQERLNQSHNPLTDKLREIINKHPNLSVTLLRQLGVTDEHWLNIIEQHHEKRDGSGYPAGLKGDQILDDALLLAMIERYTSMVTVRGYRRRYLPEEAIREIVVDAQQDRQNPMYEVFYREISKYPPGTFVELANGEVAIVIRREGNGQPLHIKSILTPGGSPYLVACPRDCREKDYRITQGVVPGFMPLLNLPSLWDYAR